MPTLPVSTDNMAIARAVCSPLEWRCGPQPRKCKPVSPSRFPARQLNDFFRRNTGNLRGPLRRFGDTVFAPTQNIGFLYSARYAGPRRAEWFRRSRCSIYPETVYQ